MTTTNSVLLEINSSSIIQLVKTLDLLKENNVSFNILEEEEKKPEPKPILIKNGYKKLLGNNGINVLQSLADGYSYKEIAERETMSVDGVRYYIKKIFKALGVNNGRDAVRIYLTEMSNNN